MCRARLSRFKYQPARQQGQSGSPRRVARSTAMWRFGFCLEDLIRTGIYCYSSRLSWAAFLWRGYHCFTQNPPFGLNECNGDFSPTDTALRQFVGAYCFQVFDYSVDGINQTQNEKDQKRRRECHEKCEDSKESQDNHPNRDYRSDQIGRPRVADLLHVSKRVQQKHFTVTLATVEIRDFFDNYLTTLKVLRQRVSSKKWMIECARKPTRSLIEVPMYCSSLASKDQ